MHIPVKFLCQTVHFLSVFCFYIVQSQIWVGAMLNHGFPFFIKNPRLLYFFFLAEPDSRRLICDCQQPSLKIDHSATALRLMNIMFCQYTVKFFLVIQRSQKKFFHIKSVYHISKFMFVSEKTGRNLTDLNPLSQFPEKLHGKCAFFLACFFHICLKKFRCRFFHF